MLTLLKNKQIVDDELKVFACVKDGIDRLPFFLGYYRDLGVSTFFIVDNNSKDGTAEFLKGQDDVVLLWTDESYQEANAGRNWIDELMLQYADNGWCLTVDIDEFLIYPLCEFVKLPMLCNYLEEGGFQGLLTLLLDYYPKGKVQEAGYNAGDSVFEVAECHDSANRYAVHSDTYFPYFNIRGGVRQRLFFSSDNPLSGPPQKKIPLVKHHDGFRYLYSTHGTSSLRLADVTGVLAHFKFFSTSENYFLSEIKGKDRRNPKHYNNYLKGIKRHDSFFSEDATRITRDSTELANDGYMAVSPQYLRHLESHHDNLLLNEFAQRLDQKFFVPLNQFMKSWPLMISLQQSGANLPGEISEYRDAMNYVAASRKHFSLGLSLPLRKWLRKHKLIPATSLPEFMDHGYTLKEQIRFTYRSVAWELAAPIRLAVHAYRYVRNLFR